jgi:DNA modification methylase
VSINFITIFRSLNPASAAALLTEEQGMKTRAKMTQKCAFKTHLNTSFSDANRRFWHPKIELWPIKKVRPSKRNARTHSKKQRDKLLAIIRRFGFINPIIIDENGTVIAGHLRLEVAGLLGMTHVPIIQVTHLTDLDKRALALAENRIALDAGWDRETLAAELGELAVLLPEVEIELVTTGFDIAETDLIIADHAEPPEDRGEDQLPDPGPAVSRLHDLWIMAGHRLYCGDARDLGVYAKLMCGASATMVFTDPPYNVSIRTHARGRSLAFVEFAMASGEMSAREYQGFLERVLEAIAGVCIDGAIVYICIDWRHLRQLLEAAALFFSELKNICVWVKSNGGQGSFYRSQHEMICVFKQGTSTHLNSFELGQHGRSRTNVWSYAGVNSFKAGREDELRMHPTVKPTRLVADAMLDCSRRRSIVLDPFMGSGTTIIAGETVGRRVYGTELDPRYVDVAVRRWERFTGKDAMLESTGQTFSEVQAARNSSAIVENAPPLERKPRKGAR